MCRCLTTAEAAWPEGYKTASSPKQSFTLLWYRLSLGYSFWLLKFLMVTGNIYFFSDGHCSKTLPWALPPCLKEKKIFLMRCFDPPFCSQTMFSGDVKFGSNLSTAEADLSYCASKRWLGRTDFHLKNIIIEQPINGLKLPFSVIFSSH